jgi:hypothetical protein
VRRIRRLNEQSSWSAIPREFDEYRLSYAGRLEGLQPPVQRLVRVTPYVLQRGVRDYQAGDTEFDYPTEVGADAKVQITQGLTLDLTVNTDFAQVEVDEVQTNLTRFNISFPEKRSFFLENAGFFQVGAGGADLFFSRRVGISSSGPVPILGGGRLSGRAGGLNVGLLHIETDDIGTVLPQQQYSVARVARELPNRSRIGGAFLRRASDATNDWNRTWVVDGQLGIGEPITISSFLAKTQTPTLTGRDHAFDLQGAYTARSLRSSVNYREIGEDFNPELGFMPRNGYRYVQALTMYYIRPERFGLREMRPHVSYYTYRDIETGFDESSRWHIDSHWEFEDGMELHTGTNWTREGLEEPFEIYQDESRTLVVPTGTYDGWEAQLVFFTNESALLSFNGGMTAGSFLTGSRVNPYGTFTVRPSSAFSAGLRLDYNDVSLPEGDFQAVLVGLRLAYFFTPRIYLQSLTQYSDLADAWSTNVRFGWLDDAGSGLFVVYNQANGFDSLERDTPLNRALTIKYSRLFDVARW